MRRKHTRIAMAILLGITLLWANVNAFYFYHAHINDNGRIVVHTHPFQKNPDGRALPGHTHSKIEYIFLSFAFHTFLFFIACFFLWQRLFPRLLARINTRFQSDQFQIFIESRLNRGPPSFTSI